MSVLVRLAQLYFDKKISEEEYNELIKRFTKIGELSERHKVGKLKNLDEELEKVKTIDLTNKTVEQLIDMANEPWRYYHLEDLLAQLPIFGDYPYIVLDSFFSHPNEEEVIFRSTGTRPFSEKLPIVLYELLPGAYSCRWERPRKVVTGGLKQFPGGIYVTTDLQKTIEGEIIEEIPSDYIPSDFPRGVLRLPEGKETLGVLKPRAMKFIRMPTWWYKTAPGVPVCPSCGRVPDGDEIGESRNFCPECSKVPLVRTRTIPETFAKSGYLIKSGPKPQSLKETSFSLRKGEFDPPLIVSLPKFANDLFKEIFFTENLQVTHFYYEFQRRYTHRKISTNPISIYFRFGNRPVALGTKLTTDGFILQYNELVIEEVVNQLITNKNLITEIKSILVQFLFHVTREALNNDLGYFEYNRVFKVLVQELLRTNGLVLPSNLESIQSQVMSLLSNEEKIKESLRSQKPELTDRRVTRIVEKIAQNKANFNKMDEANFKTFLSIGLIHSLAHAVVDSLQKISGATEHATGYFFDLDQKEIYIFDTVSGGSGLSETAKEYFYVPFSYRNAIIRQRLGRFDTTPTFLPTRDFLTYLEEYFTECTDYVSARILFEIVKNLDPSLLWDLWKSAEKRTQFLKELVEKHRLLLEDQASFLEFNLRNGTALLFKYLQSKLSINNYQDLFALYEVPDLTYQALKNEVSDQELKKLLRHEDFERQKQELSDLLSLCYASCPTCSLPSRCIYGYFESTYYVNHRILRFFYDHLIRNKRVNPTDETDMNEFISKVKNMLAEKKVVYIEVDIPGQDFGVISPFIGYRDGREFKVKVDEDSDVIYATTNYKFSQVTPLFDQIKIVDERTQIPQRLLIKLELS